jgi:UDP-glucose 4-epimerase
LRRVLITGGSGLLGLHVLRQMSGAFEPICIGRSRPTVDRDMEYVEVDLCEWNFSNRLPSKIDAVMHLAQGEDFNDFPKGASNIFGVNVASAAVLLEWAQTAGATHFIHASTGGLYGLGPQPFKETDAVKIAGRLAYYYSTKFAAEMVANAYRDYLTVVSLRYFFIYGVDQRPSMLMPRLINAVHAGRPIALSGKSGMRLNPIEVKDAAAAAISALAMDASNTINVAGPDVVSMRQLGEAIAFELGRPVSFDNAPAPEGQDLVADISLMSAWLGAPHIGIKKGIASMCSAASRVWQ